MSKPLAPKKKASLSLAKFKDCTVSVAVTFEGGGQSTMNEHDVCKDKSIRFTD